MSWIGGLFALATGLLWAAAAVGSPDEGDPWARVLAAHQRDGGLDYAGLQAARQDLDACTASLASASPAESSRREQIAFWVNAYNAVVARFVLERYPELESVKDVPGFFDRQRWPVAGEELTLDEIEDRALELGDPRVHFAVVCASTSCPDLRGEPFSGERLDEQLADQTRRFLADPGKGMRYDRAANEVWLSSIFKWYADDFTGGSRVVAYFARGRVLAWVLEQLPEAEARVLRQNDPAVRYLDYDWSLNDRP